MGKTLYLTRHAQAEHNVAEDYSIPDAVLTALGRDQAARLNDDTRDTIQRSAQAIVSSPLRRPMQTALIGYPALIKRLGGVGQITLLPELQEVNDLPCDTGSARDLLESDPEFDGLDFSTLDAAERREGVKWTSKKGLYSPDRVEERARWVRRYLRDRPEDVIVVVAHGDILRCLTEGRHTVTPWANAEVREYTFAEDNDEAARIVKVEAPVEKEGKNAPTSSDMKN